MRRNYQKESLVDQKFNKWTVKEFIGKTGTDNTYLCECECGKIRPVKAYHLTNNYSTQCVDCAHKSEPYKEELFQAFWNQVVRRATRKNHYIDITKDEAYQIFLDQNKKCALTGLDIHFAKCGKDFSIRRDYQTASLDRIDSSKGYTKDNVQWVHKDINRMKNIYQEDYFLYMCKLVTEYNSIDHHHKGTT